MNSRFPASVLVSLAVAGGATALYLILLPLLLPSYSAGDVLLHGALLSGIIAVVCFLLMRLVVYPRMKNVSLENQLEIRKLKEMEAYRREFIGDVSHELKTPIFAIQGFIETLLEGAISDPNVNMKFLQKALKHSERLSNLVEDILVITQIEAGELGMNLEEFDIQKLARETVDSLVYKFTNKGRDIKYKVSVKNLEDKLVLADRHRIEQVLRNLIDNAVKYGDSQGTIVIELEGIPQQKVVVRVADQGPGIDPQHLPRLFERFYRVDKSRSREKGGTGLGLAICKHLIEAHHEKIWVESELGKGSVFQFTLRRAS